MVNVYGVVKWRICMCVSHLGAYRRMCTRVLYLCNCIGIK